MNTIYTHENLYTLKNYNGLLIGPFNCFYCDLRSEIDLNSIMWSLLVKTEEKCPDSIAYCIQCMTATLHSHTISCLLLLLMRLLIHG